MTITNQFRNCRGSYWRKLILSVLLFAVTLSSGQAAEEQPIQKKDIAEIIDSVTAAFKLHYVYTDTARALSDYLHAQFDEGKYDDITELSAIAGQLRDDIRSFTHDRHVWISVMTADDSPVVGDTITDAEIQRRARTNFNIRKAEWLLGNVGYVRFDGFEDALYAGETAANAMNFVSRCDAIIIDLRYNHGGHETMVRFLGSYFFRGPTMINALYFPETDSLEQSWTSAYVPGHKMVNSDLYILTSHATGSGAEAFAYGMKHAGRAVIVGETTVGAAHWTEGWEFPNIRIRAEIPIARPINPVTKTSWERSGVTPDIEVSSSDALVVAHHEALKKLLAKTADQRVRDELSWTLADVEAQVKPIMLTARELKSYTGSYVDGRYTIFTKDDALVLQFSDNSEYRLIPLSADLFRLGDENNYRISFIRGNDSSISGFRILVQGREPGPVRDRTGDI